MKYLEKEHNWDFHVKDYYDNDAYLTASSNGQLEIMKYLEKEHNWDIHVKNNNGRDALFFAKKEKHENIIKYLKLKNRKRKFHKISQNKNEECYICLEEFTKGDKYCKCHNGHIYHEGAFLKCLKINVVFVRRKYV